MNNIKLLLFLGGCLTCGSQTINAQCVATQDCSKLGYTKTSCNGGSGVKCPFGNKWACFKTDTEFCTEYGFTLSCNDANQTGGSSPTCNGKYNVCKCKNGYEWDVENKSCKKIILNGAYDNLYYCNDKVVGVKTDDMNFYVAMQDAGYVNWNNAGSTCGKYSFCNYIKGKLPSSDQLKTIYKNKSTINNLLTANGGYKLTEDDYCSSTYDDGSNFYLGYYIVDMSSGFKSGPYDPNPGGNCYVRPILIDF